MTSNNNQIVWVKLDTKRQFCEIDGVRYVARLVVSPKDWTSEWRIAVEGTRFTRKPLATAQYLTEAKKKFTRLMSQPMVDQPQPAPTLSPALTDAESIANAEQHARSISAVRQYKRIVVAMEWHEIEFLMSVHPTHLDLSEPPNVLILSSEEFGGIVSALAQSPNIKLADAVLNRIGKALGDLSAEYTSTSGVKVESMDEYMQREYNRTLTPIETELEYNQPQPYRVITRDEYQWLWREARMAQLDKCFDYYYFPIPEGAEFHTSTWYQMIEYYFDNPPFRGWVNDERYSQWSGRLFTINYDRRRKEARAQRKNDTAIPHAIEAPLAPVSITEEILTATDSYLTLATNIDDITAIYEAQDGLAEIVEDAKPLKPRNPHDLAIGVWHTMQAEWDLLPSHGLLIRYCKVHGLEYREVRNELVYQVSKDNPKGWTRKEHNLTDHEVKEFIRAVDAFTSQAPVTVQG